MKVKNTHIYFLFIAVFLLSSCGSKKILYNPNEIEVLSKQLKIPINNDDKNIPLFAEVSLWLNAPYKYGGNSKKGVDCSGFVYQVFNRVYSKNLQRSSDDQAKKDVNKVAKKNLKTGDLVFFQTLRKSKKIDHVGIYLKNGKFIHASTSKGVIVSDLNEKYYDNSWIKGGRVK